MKQIARKTKTHPSFSILGSSRHGVIRDVLDGEVTGVDQHGLLVGDLELELLLQRHDDLHVVQAIQSQIPLEVDLGGHLRSIDRSKTVRGESDNDDEGEEGEISGLGFGLAGPWRGRPWGSS